MDAAPARSRLRPSADSRVVQGARDGTDPGRFFVPAGFAETKGAPATPLQTRGHDRPLMLNQRICTYCAGLTALGLVVAGLLATPHQGVVKSGRQPIPGATVTAIQGERKVVTTTDDSGAYSLADLPSGVWTIQVEMLGFAKLSNEVGIAFDAPAPEWNLKFLPMSVIMAPPAAPSIATEAAPAKAAGAAGTPAPVAASRHSPRGGFRTSRQGEAAGRREALARERPSGWGRGRWR